MKTDDIFEALTDIDDKFIENAHPTKLNDDQPVIVRPAEKKPLWKMLVPIAACLAVLCAAGTFGVKYLKDRPRSETSEDSTASGGGTSFSQLGASAQKVSRIDIPDDGSDTEFTMDEFPAFNFKVSNRAVTSVLKTPPEMDVVIENSLFDDKIQILGLYLADLNGDGKRELCASVCDPYKGHGIMVNDFADGLKYDKETQATTVDNTADGMLYALSSDGKVEYALAEEDGVLKAVKTVWQPGYSSTIPNELSREPLTLDMMTRISKVTELKKIPIPPNDTRHDFSMDEFRGYTFTATHNSVLLNGYAMNAVDVPIISGDSIEDLYLCDLNGDGRRELCATVRNDGIRSVEVVDFAESYCGGDKWYTLQGNRYTEYYLGGRQGDALMFAHAEQYGSDRLVSSTQLSLDMMTPILSQKFSQEFSNNAIVATKIEAEKKFKLAEFPDKTFEITKHSIVMSDITTPDAMIRPVISGTEYYLTDLNGDGMREICCWGSIGSGIVSFYITVYDIANDEFYYLKGERPSDKWQTLDVKDGVLYAVTSEYLNEDKEISREPLSLDILEKVTRSDTAYEEVPLYVDQIFTMEDFPGITFMVTNNECPMFHFNWGSESVSENVNRVFLYDIDGDGKREIALNCLFAGNGCIRVYGFMDNGEPGCAEYYEDGGCWLNEGENGTLMYYTNDKIETFKFSKSDLKPPFARNYSYELLGWDHTLDFTEILPSLGAYEVTINNRTVKIKHNGEQIFDSGIWLQDLYSIPDKENNSVILIYITESVGGNEGMVGAIKLSEKNAERYDFEKGVSIKPTTDALLIVNADGSEEPFNFPEDSTSLLQ